MIIRYLDPKGFWGSEPTTWEFLKIRGYFMLGSL